MIGLLPPWILTNPQPAFLDSESGSVLEQTAKMYAKVNELIESYNLFTSGIDKKMADFLKADEKAKEEHMTAIRQEFQDFIDIVALKLQEFSNLKETYSKAIENQNKAIDNAVSYMQTNLKNTVTSEIADLIKTKKLNVGFTYEENEEELSLIVIPLDSDNTIVYTSEHEQIDIV